MRSAPTARAILIVVAAAGSLALLPSQGVAGKLTVNLADTEITSMSLVGDNSVPLATGGVGAIDGYGPIDTRVTVTESTLHVSTVQATVEVTTLDSFNFDFAVSSTVKLFADLSFEDIDDERNFASGLGNPFALSAPSDPMTMTLTDTFSLNLIDLALGASISDEFSPIVSSTTAVYPLGADVNDNNDNDVIKLDASDLSFELEDIVLSDLEIDEATLEDLLGGEDVTINISLGLGITGTSLVFAGDILDQSSDPPFNISLTGPTSSQILQAAVPEPASVAFAAMGLAALLGVAWRYRRRA